MNQPDPKPQKQGFTPEIKNFDVEKAKELMIQIYNNTANNYTEQRTVLPAQKPPDLSHLRKNGYGENKPCYS